MPRRGGGAVAIYLEHYIDWPCMPLAICKLVAYIVVGDDGPATTFLPHGHDIGIEEALRASPCLWLC